MASTRPERAIDKVVLFEELVVGFEDLGTSIVFELREGSRAVCFSLSKQRDAKALLNVASRIKDYRVIQKSICMSDELMDKEDMKFWWIIQDIVGLDVLRHNQIVKSRR